MRSLLALRPRVRVTAHRGAPFYTSGAQHASRSVLLPPTPCECRFGRVPSAPRLVRQTSTTAAASAPREEVAEASGQRSAHSMAGSGIVPRTAPDIYINLPPPLQSMPVVPRPWESAPVPGTEQSANKLAHCVVEIKSDTGFGTGWLYDRARGLVVTCQHVAHGEDGEVRPRLHIEAEGAPIECRLLGSDAARDISVLQVDPALLPDSLEEATIGESRAGFVYTATSLFSPQLATLLSWLDHGVPQWLHASSYSPLELSVYAGGYLSAPVPYTTCAGRLLFKFHGFLVGRGHAGRVLATDAPLEEGYSGGPLVNARGEVIGLNFAFVRRSDVVRGGWPGRWSPAVSQLSLALASEEVVRAVEVLARGGSVPDPLFGVRLELSDGAGRPSGPGAHLCEVLEGSSAARGGLRDGDRVVALGGQTVEDQNDFARALYSRCVGERVRVEAVRGGRPVSLELVLGERDGSTCAEVW
eukprot:tig00000147_g9496.t2